MTKYEVLTQLSNKEIKVKDAYNLLYSKQKDRKLRKASFIKLKIIIPNERKVTVFLSILFLLPIPIFLVRMFMTRKLNTNISNEFPMTYKEALDLVQHKDIKIYVTTKTNEKIRIKTI